MTSSNQGISARAMPSLQELEAVFFQKHGRPEAVGWAPRRRFRFHYYLPSDIYEAVVAKRVFPGCTWLDVGGGRAIFPENPRLARELVARCAKVVAVDPSENVHRNDFAHERVQSMLEDYHPATQFDLATMRMVVEHVAAPERFAGALSRLVRPGGVAVVFTVNLWSPITLVSRVLPFGVHYPIKRLLWGGHEEDTFPVQYRMNTRAALRRVFDAAGFDEQAFARLDDLAALGNFKRANHLDLLVWRGLRSLKLRYPEHCLLGVYQRR